MAHSRLHIEAHFVLVARSGFHSRFWFKKRINPNKKIIGGSHQGNEFK
jgi:hypothetical protein